MGGMDRSPEDRTPAPLAPELPPLPPEVPADLRAHAIDALRRLVAIPSVSAEGMGAEPAADEVGRQLRDLGFEVERHATAGAPVVFGRRPARGGAPTILFYNHYDVQSPDPLELWSSDPFDLDERDGMLFGRGVSDDKGQLVARLAALRWCLARDPDFGLGAVFVVEGEEEIGSPNLPRYVAAHAADLRADGAVWEFGGVTAAGRPMTYCGLKGIACLELRSRTAEHDLHSSVGAVVDNPIYRLSAAIASLRDGEGRVLIDGFYDDVVAPSPADEALLAALPDESAELAEAYGLRGAYLGRVGGTAFQRKLLFEPNVNLNGFHAGYGGRGSKTVLPAEAVAKIDLRLVPEQDPDRIVAALRAHLAARGFADVEVLELESHERAVRSDATHPWVRHTIAALRETYGLEPVVYPNVAGSGPMHAFVEHLGVPIVGLGCSYPGARVHGPNEHVRVRDLDASVRATVRLLERFVADPQGLGLPQVGA